MCPRLRRYLVLFVFLSLFCPAMIGKAGFAWEKSLAVQGSVFDELIGEEISDGKYFRLIDGKGKLITITGRRIRPGDRYLDEKNRLYEVSHVRDYLAIGRYLRTEKLAEPERRGVVSDPLAGVKTGYSPISIPAQNSAREDETSRNTQPSKIMPEKKKLIAIYHTHNDECYVPTDGTESVYGHGGIHQVGAALQSALEEKNIDAIHSEDMHLPHDEGAYRRSRDTALKLLEQNPDAIFDIHRDAAPMDAYAVQVGKDWVTKIQFVVGRENPSSVVTCQYAYDMKGLADDIYPGLVKGIFMGWGVYNQDLTPLNLLLEVGAHENSQDAAEKSMGLFADVVAKYFYGIPVKGEGQVLPRADLEAAVGGSSIGGTIAVIIILVAAALAGFYFLNNPGAWDRFKGRLAYYLGRKGIVWREGLHNIVLIGKKFVSGLRMIVVYILIFIQLLPVLFHKILSKLKRLKQ